MKNKSIRGMPVALLALVLSAVAGLESAAAVNNPTTTNTLQKSKHTSFQLAQGIVGQCRAAKQRIFVYSQRSTSSPTVRTIDSNEQVTLADDGAVGWIAISAPAVGYVRASELTTCQSVTPSKPSPTPPAPSPAPPAPSPRPSTPPTPPPSNTTTSLCRVVAYNGPEGGLAIRTRPDRVAPRVDGARFGDRVTLRTSPPPITVDKDGRNWIEVTAPSRGWISNGYPKSPNLGLCP
jgi:hypothetical protein